MNFRSTGYILFVIATAGDWLFWICSLYLAYKSGLTSVGLIAANKQMATFAGIFFGGLINSPENSKKYFIHFELIGALETIQKPLLL